MDQQEVAPSLKARFAEWIDKRTELGISKYGQPLLTNNGRDPGQDAIEELLDFCQYQEQSRLELLAEIKDLRQTLLIAHQHIFKLTYKAGP